jgi:glycosyltransferase involved in cell wall biosynthesis
MRILMIAPEPFLAPRGTPISVYNRIRALLTLGYQVDLVTYPVGKQVALPGLRVYRAPRLPFIREVKIGPSLAKFVLDLFVLLIATKQLFVGRYGYIHTHEEACVMGAALSRVFGCKHLYDMHSDLAEEMTNFSFIKNRWLIHCVEALQKWVVHSSAVVIAVYPELERKVKNIAPGKPVYLVINAPVDMDLPAPDEQSVAELRHRLELEKGPVLVYTGTFESYQGIDLLLRSIPHVRATCPQARYVLVGGRSLQIAQLQRLAEELGVADMVRFVGQRSPEEMPLYMALADILLSPRNKGTNTPLKLYTYLRSGKPLLATQIYSHTQILNSDIAMLVPPTAEDLAKGTVELLQNPQPAGKLASNARKVADENYSWEIFLERNRRAYEAFTGVRLDRELDSQRTG